MAKEIGYHDVYIESPCDKTLSEGGTCELAVLPKYIFDSIESTITYNFNDWHDVELEWHYSGDIVIVRFEYDPTDKTDHGYVRLRNGKAVARLPYGEYKTVESAISSLIYK